MNGTPRPRSRYGTRMLAGAMMIDIVIFAIIILACLTACAPVGCDRHADCTGRQLCDIPAPARTCYEPCHLCRPCAPGELEPSGLHFCALPPGRVPGCCAYVSDAGVTEDQ